MRVDVWPVDGGPCPAKAGGIIIGPTLVPVAADRVLPLLREKQRGYHAYIRHLDLNSFPDVADRLPLKRARSSSAGRASSPRTCGSATAACGRRCTGTATTTCCCSWKGAKSSFAAARRRVRARLPPLQAPRLAPLIGRTRGDRSRYVLSPAFSEHEHCKADVENHCTFDAFSCDGDITAGSESERTSRSSSRARLCSYRHYGTTPSRASPIRLPALNCAANLWFVLGTAAHDAALREDAGLARGVVLPGGREALARRPAMGDRPPFRRTNEL